MSAISSGSVMSVNDGLETVIRASANLPTDWEELDLSSWIGSKRSLVEIGVRNGDVSNGNVMLVRAKGAAISYTGATSYAGTHFAAYPATTSKYSRVISITDENGVVEIKGNAARLATVYLISFIN